MNIKKYQEPSSGIIRILDLPKEYVAKYPNMKVTTPSGLSVTLSEAYSKYGDTPVKRSDVPHLTDTLLYQSQNDINDARKMDIRAGDRHVNDISMTQPTIQQINNLGDMLGLTFGTGLALPFAITTPFAAVGAFAGGMAGNWAGDKATQYFSNGKYNTWGNAMEDWTNGYVRADNGQFTNPGALIGGAIGGISGNIVGNQAEILANNAVRSIARKVLMPRVYKYVTPMKYLNSANINHSEEFWNILKSIGKFEKVSTDEIPNWILLSAKRGDNKINRVNGDEIPVQATWKFRDDALRESLALPLREGPNTYVPNGDGTMSYNMDFVNQMRKVAGGNEFSEVPAKTPYGYFDNITGNGGGVNVSLSPDGTHFVMTDVWDILPFKDPLRLPFENNRILNRFSHWMHENHPNFELMNFLGGKPLILKHTF